MLYHEMLRMDADVLLRETSEFTKQERLVTALLLVRLAAVEPGGANGHPPRQPPAVPGGGP